MSHLFAAALLLAVPAAWIAAAVATHNRLTRARPGPGVGPDTTPIDIPPHDPAAVSAEIDRWLTRKAQP